MNNLKKKLLVMLMALSMALALIGCGNGAAQEQPEAKGGGGTETEAPPADVSQQEASSQQKEPMQQAAYPLTVTDSNGDEVTLESEPQKIVSVAPNLTELVYALGAGDLLVGRSDYCDYPQEVSAVESVGTITTPDIEKLISFEPDLVLVSTHFDEENTQKLNELNVPVLTLYEENSMEGVYDMVETLGTALNRSTQAEECISQMQEIVSETEDKVKGLDAPTVYYVVGYGEYGDYTAGGDTFVGKMLEAAGGDNIAKEVTGWSITLEEIIEKDPSIIIIGESMKDDFMSSPNYSDLTAVKENRVYGIDNNMLDRQGYRNAEGLRTLAEIFHPEAFE